MTKTSLNRATSSYQPLTKDKGKGSFPKTEEPVQPNREYTSPETLELQGYKQPKLGAMVENVMAAQLAGMSDQPMENVGELGNQLRAPRPSDNLGSVAIQPKLTAGRPPSTNVGELGNQLRAPRPSNNIGSMAIQPKLTVGRPPSLSVGELGNILRASRPSNNGSMTIQPKLTIGEPNDVYEQEADRVARRVVDEINTPAPVQRQTGEEELQTIGENEFGINQKEPMVQREEMEEEMLSRKVVVNKMDGMVGAEASVDLETAIEGARGSGQHLDPALQAQMGQAMGADFSGVRVHTDGQSDRLNQSIQAKAFTTGQDVFFRQGEYNPGSRGGQELIAHELTHVVQQNGGTVMRSRLNIQQQLSKSIVQRSDIPGDGEDLANGTQPPEKLDGPYDDGEVEEPPKKRQKTEKAIQTKRESGQLVFAQKEDNIQRSEKDQSNLWAKQANPENELSFWGRTTTNSRDNGSLIIQRVTTRNKGVPPVSYKGMAAGGGGGGRPPVPKSTWQNQTVGGKAYKFWNEADGTLEFTAPKAGGGPALVAKHTVNIDAGGGKMKVTGRSLKNTRYQHFLTANCLANGINAKAFAAAQPKNPPGIDGKSPPNYTWHHHKNKGKMELIDRDVHAAFAHHGGFSIWGS